jgi:CcmD family protein
MDTRNFTFMFYGFAAAWLILVIYVLLLVSRERKLRSELARVREMLGQSTDSAAAGKRRA